MSNVLSFKSIAVFICLLLAGYSYAQTDTLNKRIFLIGDAGELVGNTHPVIDWMQEHIDWNDERNMVIFLGDNIYPMGMPMEHTPTYAEAKHILDYQISLVKDKKAQAYFIPGNHDWKNGKLGGWQQVVNQENYITALGLPNVHSVLSAGCPGPEVLEVSDKVVVAFIDSEWWLYLHEKPGPTSTCSSRTEDEIIAALQDIANAHPNQLLVVAMHHPLYSYGPHGGNYNFWKSGFFPFTDYRDWLYIPLPIIGFVYPIARGIFGNIQDVHHPIYRDMIKGVEEVLQKHTNSIHVAGHDHGLQMLIKDSIPYIVSGSGSNLSRLRNGKYTVFEDRNYGFSVIEVYNSGKVDVKFYTRNNKDMSDPIFTKQIDSIVTVDPPPPLDSIRKLPAYITKAANPKLKGNGFRNFLMGKNYRPEWTTPVTVPVINFGTELGGITPIKEGGGKQTRSLRVADTTGKEWALRSVQKFPENAIPADLRRTVAKDLVEDGISASYPYGAISVPPLAQAAGVPALKGKLVFIPDDPRLLRFRTDFKNMLATMEEREPDTIRKKNVDNTDEVVLKLFKDNDRHIDQKEVLRARLLDNFIMDFDRHEGQWSWAAYDTGKGKVYYAIPKDRDQAFFTNQGVLPWFVRQPSLVPELQGFRARARNIKTFNRPARNFDRFFLTGLDENDWQRAIDTFLHRMTDSVIVAALMRQPNEIQHYSVPDIINTLKERRKYFRSDMMKYYRFLSKTVSITGSNDREQFTVTKNNDGSVHVQVNKITKADKVTGTIYERQFDPKVTKELRLYGLEEADRFVVEGGNSPIKIRIIGGPGNDTFSNKGSGGRVLVYDATFEKNAFTGNSGLIKRTSKEPQVNSFDRLSFKYNVLSPGLTLDYNIDDGLFVGAHLKIVQQGFRKEPFAIQHYIMASRALRTSSYHFKYNADFTKITRHEDLLIRSDVRAPINITNFFGIGNNTTKSAAHPGGLRYYRARYDVANASVLLSRLLQSWMRINYGPAFQYLKLNRQANEFKYVNNTAVNGLDAASLYQSKTYAGARVALNINSRNSEVIPTRGFVLDAGITSLYGLNKYSNNVTQLKWDMKLFISRTSDPHLVVGWRVGAGHNIGAYEFEQAQYLSGTENLRGFRKDRFAGRTMFFNNIDLRYKIADFATYLFPGSIGFLLFDDIGRVWADGEQSGRWHMGYGAGIWVAPIRRFVVTASVVRSKEENALPLVTFGFQF